MIVFPVKVFAPFNTVVESLPPPLPLIIRPPVPLIVPLTVTAPVTGPAFLSWSVATRETLPLRVRGVLAAVTKLMPALSVLLTKLLASVNPEPREVPSIQSAEKPEAVVMRFALEPRPLLAWIWVWPPLRLTLPENVLTP